MVGGLELGQDAIEELKLPRSSVEVVSGWRRSGQTWSTSQIENTVRRRSL